MSTSELLKQSFSVLVAVVLLYDMLKARREMSQRIIKLDDRYKNILEGLVKDSIQTNQKLTAALSGRPCMLENHENKK